MNGLDLFSGIGGIAHALRDYIQPVAYCEVDPYAQAVLLDRQRAGDLPVAPIWDDVRTLRGSDLPQVDIICGGFPCQDISCAGRRAGLGGERSGLFFQIMRLVDEVRPPFIFLENVAAITNGVLGTVAAEVSKRGYDLRWAIVSAAEVGAWHRRERWWCLAHFNNDRRGQSSESQLWAERKGASDVGGDGEKEPVADSKRVRQLQPQGIQPVVGRRTSYEGGWWASEPNVVRVVHGLPFRVDRIKCLGNSVVPQCAKAAFKELMGL